jgi:xylulokinase
LQWYKDEIQPSLSFDELIEEAAQVEPGCEGLFFLPYLTGERTPHPDPQARGAFIGHTTRHTRAHMTRAVLEGVAFGLKDSFHLIAQAGLPEKYEVRISGGGAKSPIWQQIIADIIGAPLVSINTTEGAAFGAALLAGVAAGVYPDVASACRATIQTTQTVNPSQQQSAYEKPYSIYQGLYGALKDVFAAL